MLLLDVLVDASRRLAILVPRLRILVGTNLLFLNVLVDASGRLTILVYALWLLGGPATSGCWCAVGTVFGGLAGGLFGSVGPGFLLRDLLDLRPASPCEKLQYTPSELESADRDEHDVRPETNLFLPVFAWGSRRIVSTRRVAFYSVSCHGLCHGVKYESLPVSEWRHGSS